MGPPTRALAALAMLDCCPYVPADVIARLLGLRSRAAAYQLLARLKKAGLAQVQPVDLGHVLGGRRLELWTLTERGHRQLGDHADTRGTPANGVLAYGVRAGPPARARPTELPLLVSTYRMLATVVTEQDVTEPVRVLAWEYRWRRTCEPPGRDNKRRVAVELPGAAALGPRSGRPGWSVLLLPDLGTTPVARYRPLVGRLLALRAAEDDPRTPQPVLVVATPDPDGYGSRADAWRRLLAEVAAREQETPLRSCVLTWQQVAALGSGPQDDGRPATTSQQVLDLVGRHPCLSLDQLAVLLGTSRRRAARLRDGLVARGWLRPIPVTDIPAAALAQLEKEPRALGLAELTLLGRRVLAGWLGLSGPTAARHHGLSGGQDWAGRRRRLLRTLPHTLGTNDIFVALAAAARRATARGQDEELEEWRSAAACERRLCKPDGYGRYRRGQATFGFFLEYDRATERAASYAAKFDAYYRYRASHQAAREYAGFPSVLVVTTDGTAEHRLAEAATRAWARQGGPPLAVLITRTDLIAGQPDGVLGAIWRVPGSQGGLRRVAWPPERPLPGIGSVASFTSDPKRATGQVSGGGGP